MTLQYLLDTDWAIHDLNAHRGIVERLHDLLNDGLGLSVISLAELYEGVYYSRDPGGDEQDLNDFLRGVTVLALIMPSVKSSEKNEGAYGLLA